MSRDILRDRENALEFEFCHKVDQKLLANLREQLRSEKRQEGLSRATGIKDESVLEELDSLNISHECILAFSLYPLVHVAWSDGDVDKKERAAILDVAETVSHQSDTPSARLLDAWLQKEPSEAMFTAWKHYIKALLATLSPVARRAVKYGLISRSRLVAKAAGGMLGVHKTSAAEGAAIAELEAAFLVASHQVE